MKRPASITLSEEDVRRLTADKSETNRAGVAVKLGAHIDGDITDQERSIADDILRILARDVAVTVRQHLAESLKNSSNIPKDVAITLAKDVEQVALPLLRESLVFDEQDLISVIENGSEAKQAVIAQREDVTETVSTAIVDHGSETAVAELMKNQQAKINDQGYNRALDRFPTSDKVHGSLVRRQTELPSAVTKRLVHEVSDQLLSFLVTRSDLSQEVASDLLIRSRERAAVDLIGEGDETDSESMRTLVKNLCEGGHLNAPLLFRALCVGDLDFFEVALSHMSELPILNARLLIYDEGPLGLKTIYQRAKLPLKYLPSSRVALNMALETLFDGSENDMDRRRRKIIERVLTQVQDLNDDDLDYLMEKLDTMKPIDFKTDAALLYSAASNGQAGGATA